MKFFTRAILRQPGKNFVNAIAQDPNHEKPDYEKAIAEYKNYAKTLVNMGLQVSICEPDENFPKRFTYQWKNNDTKRMPKNKKLYLGVL